MAAINHSVFRLPIADKIYDFMRLGSGESSPEKAGVGGFDSVHGHHRVILPVGDQETKQILI
jgi:hypothetical protein